MTDCVYHAEGRNNLKGFVDWKMSRKYQGLPAYSCLLHDLLNLFAHEALLSELLCADWRRFVPSCEAEPIYEMNPVMGEVSRGASAGRPGEVDTCWIAAVHPCTTALLRESSPSSPVYDVMCAAYHVMNIRAATNVHVRVAVMLK